MPDDLTPIQQWRRNNPDPRLEGRTDEEVARALYQVRGYGERGIDENEFLSRVGAMPSADVAAEPEPETQGDDPGFQMPGLRDMLNTAVATSPLARFAASQRLTPEEQEVHAERTVENATRRRDRILGNPVAPEGMTDDQFRFATGMYREQYEALPENSPERARVDRLVAEQMRAIEQEDPERARVRQALGAEQQALIDRVNAGERAQLTAFGDTVLGVPRGAANALIGTAGTVASVNEQVYSGLAGRNVAPSETLGYRLSDQAQDFVTGATFKDPMRAHEIPSQVGEAGGQMALIAGTGPIAGTAIGAGMSSDALTRDAVESGANPMQQRISQLGGAVLGLTERLVPEGFEQAGRSIANPIMRRAASGATGFVLEGTQETGQTIGENYIANTLAGYDPDRPTMSGARDAFIVGGLVGGIAGTVFSGAPAQDDPVANMDDNTLLQTRQQLAQGRNEVWSAQRASGGSTADAVNATAPIVTQLAALDAELERRGVQVPQDPINPINTDISVQDIATGQEPEVFTRQVTGAARRQAERENRKKPTPEVQQATTQARLERELVDAAPQLSRPQAAAVGEALSLPTNHLVGLGVPEREALASNLQFVGAEPGGAEVETARSLYQFVGENALTSDSDSLLAAQLRATDPGVTPEQLRQETGWFYGPDGQWRAEISDQSARLNLTQQQLEEGNQTNPAGVPLGDYRTTLGEVLSHGPLFDAYPKMRNMPVRIKYSQRAADPNTENTGGGSYSYGTTGIQVEAGNLDQVKTILLHEVQHAIQHVEQFAPGGGIEQFEGEVKASAGQARADIGKLRRTQVFTRLKDEVTELAGGGEFASAVARKIADLVASPDAFTETDDGFSINSKGMASMNRLMVERGGLSQRQAMQTSNYVLSEVVRMSAFRNARDAVQQTYKKREPRPRTDERNRDTVFDLYFRLTGETEARDTEARANMDDAARAEATPAILNENPGANDYLRPAPASLQITNEAPTAPSPYQNEPARELFQGAADLATAQAKLAQDPASLGLTPDLVPYINPIYRPDVLPAARMSGNDKAARWLESNYAGDPITDFTKPLPDDRIEQIAALMAAEAELALENSGNAADWYSSALERTLDIMSIKYPMLTDDVAAEAAGLGSAKNAQFLFTYIMAVTSQNLDVAANAKATDSAFAQMLERIKGGDYTMSPDWGTGDKQEAMATNFRKFGPMLEAMPGDTFAERLSLLDNLFREKKTVSDWVKYMKEEGIPYSAPNQTNASAIVYGSSVLGPKIGNGFWQNLNGNFDPLTIDLWKRRTWGRLTGKSIGNPGALPKQRARLKAAVTRSRSPKQRTPDNVAAVEAQLEQTQAALASLSRSDFQTKKAFTAREKELKADIDTLTEVLADIRNLKAPEAFKAEYTKDDQALLDYAKRLLRVWNKEYGRLREVHGKKVPEEAQPTWARAAKTVVTNLGKPLDQVENGTQRAQVEKAAARALEILQGRGVSLTTADLQAALWYPEKELWGALTSKLDVDADGLTVVPASPLNASYDTVLARFLKDQGYDAEAIDRAAGIEPGRAGSGAVSGQNAGPGRSQDAQRAGAAGASTEAGEGRARGSAGRELNQEQAAPRGSILIPQAGVTGTEPVLVKMGEAADISTAIHEGGHYWLEHYREMAQRHDGVRQFYGEMAQAFGFDADPNAVIPTEAHEAFARGAEQFFAEGEAPTPGLQRIFEQFRNWMKAMYDALIAGGNIDLTPERRDIYKQMFGTEPSAQILPRLRRANVPDSVRQRPAAGIAMTDDFDGPITGERLGDMAREIGEMAGFPVREGRLQGSKALGQYNTRSGVIRLRLPEDFTTLVHEIGHALAFKHRDRYRRVMDAVKAEGALLPLTMDVATDPKTMEDEAFAELARTYIEAPAWLETTAPQGLEAFEKEFGEVAPDLLGLMRDLSVRYEAFLNQPSTAAIAGDMVSQGGANGFRGLARDMATKLKAASNSQGLMALSDKIYTSTFDKTTPIARFMERMDQIYEDRTGRRLKVRPSKDARILSRLAANGANTARVWMMEGVIPAGKIDPEGASLADGLQLALGDQVFKEWNAGAVAEFGSYLMSRRMVDEYARWNRGELKRTPDKFTLGEHRQNIKDLEFRNPTFRQAAELIFEWNDNLLKLKRDRGLISQEQFERFQAAHPHYVPLARDVRSGTQGGTGSLNKGPISKRFKGSDRSVINPIESMMRDANQTAQAIWRNETIGAMYDAAQKAGPEAGAWLEELPANEQDAQKVDLKEAYANAARAADVDERDAALILEAMDQSLDGYTMATIYRMKEARERGEPVIYLWRNGERKMLRLGDTEQAKATYQAITSLGVGEQSYVLLDWMSLPSQFLVGAVTNHPLFVMMNWQRDQLQNWALSDNGFLPGLSGVVGAAKSARGGVTENRALAFGGTMAGVGASIQRRNVGDQNSWQGFNRNAKLDINDLRKKGYKIRELASWRGIGTALDITESGSRFENASLYFKKAKKAGMSDEDAIVWAMFEANDTMDFSRRGIVFYWMNRFIPFWNAAAQGTEKGLRVATGGSSLRQIHRLMRPIFFGKPMNFTAQEKRDAARALKLWGKLSIMTLPSLAMMLLYHDDPEFQEFSEYIRATRWLFKVNGEWLMIPKPFELATPANILERGMEAQLWEDPTAFDRATRSLMFTMMPPLENPMITTGAELVANKDLYTGAPIVPDDLVGETPEMQYTERTSAYARVLGNVFGVSPLKIEHVVNSFTGNWSRDISLAGDLFDPDSPEKKLTEQFFIRGLFRNPQSGAVTRDDFWNQMSRTGGRLQAVASRYRGFAQEGDAAGGIDYLRSLDPIEARFALSQVHGVRGAGLPPMYRASHPMAVAQPVMVMNGRMRRDLRNNELTRAGTRDRIELAARDRGRAIAILDRLNGIEALDALRLSGFEAYQNRPGFDRAGQMELLREISPQLAREYEMRRSSATGFMYANTENVERVWSNAEREIDRILQDPDRLQGLIRMREAQRLRSEMPG